MEIISKRLKKLREDAGLSQTKIGQLVGVLQSSIYRYEQGQSTPSPKTFRRYADFFDVSLDYLFGKTDAPMVPIITVSRSWKPSPPKWKNSWKCAFTPIPE